MGNISRKTFGISSIDKALETGKTKINGSSKMSNKNKKTVNYMGNFKDSQKKENKDITNTMNDFQQKMIRHMSENGL